MKVVGTGGPHVLTIRFERCELDGLRAQLCERRTRATSVAAAHNRRMDGEDEGATAVRTSPHADTAYLELVEISRVLDQLDMLDPAPDTETAPVEVVGPSWFFAPVVRGAFEAAGEHLAETMRRFGDPEEYCQPQTVRGAVIAAGAWANTYADYHYVDDHGMDRWP